MKKYLLMLIFAVGLVSVCYGANPVTNDPLLTVESDRRAKYVIFFDEYNPGTDTAVFNSGGGTAVDDGQLDTSDANLDIELQIYIPTLGSTSVTVTAYGKTLLDTAWGVLHSQTYTTAMGANDADKWSMGERPWTFRVSSSAGGTPGTDSVTVTGDFYKRREP